MDRCEVPRCRTEAGLTYLGQGICTKHWEQLTADDAPPDTLRNALGIEAVPVAAMEEAMEPTSTSKTSRAEPEATPKGKAKAGKKEKAAPKETKPKREPRKREAFDGEVVVFAFRMGSNDRDRIHAAAEPAGATKFVRSAALAAATGDAKTFEALVAQAKTNLK